MIRTMISFFLLMILAANKIQCSEPTSMENLTIFPLFKENKIRIVSNSNGVGLSKDIHLIATELTKAGHQVEYVNCYDFREVPKIDINIHVELVKPFFFPFAEKNYLIPNPEWYVYDLQLIPKFDLILCKTREAERIFKSLNPNTVFIGFTSVDRFDPKIEKEYKSPIHLAGASLHKSTNMVAEIWSQHGNWPPLLVIEHGNNFKFPEVANLQVIKSYLNEESLISLQNKRGIHICPSETEGWGHYISEALSCEAIVVSTDAPPMNEFVLNKRCLVPYNRSAPYRLATNYYPDPEKFAAVIDALLALPEEELREIGKKNRLKYLEHDNIFKQNMAELFKIRKEVESTLKL